MAGTLWKNRGGGGWTVRKMKLESINPDLGRPAVCLSAAVPHLDCCTSPLTGLPFPLAPALCSPFSRKSGLSNTLNQIIIFHYSKLF